MTIESVATHFRIPISTMVKLRRIAKRENQSVQKLIVNLVYLALSQEDPSPFEPTRPVPGSKSDDFH